MINVKKWIVTGAPNKRGLTPTALWVYPNRQVRLDFDNGGFVRLKCWKCALQAYRLEILDGPKLLPVPDNF